MEDFVIERATNYLDLKGVAWREIKMMGGRCIMVDEKMCFGNFKGGLLCRVGPDLDQYLEMEHVDVMKHGKRPMKNFIVVDVEGLVSDEQLYYWLDKCLDFNPLAESSKKKSSKRKPKK